jgi:hypothetical protein
MLSLSPRAYIRVHPLPSARWFGMSFGVPAMIGVLLVAVALFALVTSNWPELVRRLVILHARYALQREVRIAQVAFTPRGRVTLTDITVFDPHRTRPLFSADELTLSYSPAKLLADPLHPLRAIHRLAVVHPVCRLTRDAHGSWNIDDLLKPAPTPSKERFVGEVVLVRGEVVVQDALGWGTTLAPGTYHLTDVGVRIAPSARGYAPFRVQVHLPQGPLQTLEAWGGIDLQTRRLQAELHLAHLDLASLQRMLAPRLPVQLTAGTAAGRVLVQAAPTAERWQVQLATVADLTGIRGSVRLPTGVVPLTIETGQVRVSESALEVVHAQGVLDTIPVQVTGTVSDFAHPILALQTSFAPCEARALTRLIPGLVKAPITWDGQCEGWAQLTGSLASPEITGAIQGLDLTTRFGHYSAVAGFFQYRDGLLTLSDLSADGFGGEVHGTLWLAVGQGAPRLLLQGTVTRCQLPALLREFLPQQDGPQLAWAPEALTGEISGPLTVTLDANQQVQVYVEPQGTFTYPSVPGGRFRGQVRLALAETRATVDVERLEVWTSAGTVQLQGVLSPDRSLAFQVRGSGLQLASLTAELPHPVRGEAFLRGRVTGTLDAPVLAGSVVSRALTVAGRRVDECVAEVHASAVPRWQIALQNVQARVGACSIGGTLTVDERAQSEDPWRLSGTLRLPQVPTHALAEALGLELPVAGLVEGELTIADALQSPQGQGRLLIRRPTFHVGGQDVTLDSASVDLTLCADTLELTSGLLSFRGMPLLVTGTLSRNPKIPLEQGLRLQLQAPALDLDALTTLSPAADPAVQWLAREMRLAIPIDVEGIVALDLGIVGRWQPQKDETLEEMFANSLRVTASLAGKDGIALNGIRFQECTARAIYDGGAHTLALTTLSLRRGLAGADYSVSLDPKAKQEAIYHLDSREVALPLTFACEDLNRLRLDLVGVMAELPAASPLAALSQAVQAIPTPLAGRGTVQVAFSGDGKKPELDARFALEELTVATTSLRLLTGQAVIDSAVHEVSLRNVIAKGWLDQQAEVTLDGNIGLPKRDKHGTMEPGALNLSLNIDQVDLGVLGLWTRQPLASSLRGKGTIVAEISGTTADPKVLASVNIDKPQLHDVQFDLLNATLWLENNRLWIGRKRLEGTGESTLHFKDSPNLQSDPIEFYGYLPFRWKGTLQPEIPLDAEVFFAVRLPRQELALLKAYAPQFPDGTGEIEGACEVRGTLARLEVAHGQLQVRAQELRLPVTQADLPNRLRHVRADIAFASGTWRGRPVNLVEVHDLSALFDRAEQIAVKPGERRNWFMRLVRKRERETAPPVGALAVEGVMRIDPASLVADGRLRPVSELLSESVFNRQEYDLYAKCMRIPLPIPGITKGTLSSYLHLTNNAIAPRRPLLTGVLFTENLSVGPPPTVSPASTPVLSSPLNPELSVAMQVGPECLFEIASDNPLYQNTLSAHLPFQATQLFSPVTQAEVDYLGADPQRLYLERDHPAFRYRAETLQAFSGTRGWVTGTLNDPRLEIQFNMQANKSQVQLPGGTLTVESGKGVLKLAPFAAQERPVLDMRGTALGTVDRYRVSARVDGNLLQGDDGAKLPVTFSTVSAPQGAPALSSDEIQKRLFGVTGLLSLFDRTQDGLAAPVMIMIPRISSSLLNPVADGVGLDSLSFELDSSRAAEVTMMTPEYIPARVAFRLGASRKFINPATWRFWVDMRVPGRLRNLSMTTDINETQRLGLNLQYQLEF